MTMIQRAVRFVSFSSLEWIVDCCFIFSEDEDAGSLSVFSSRLVSAKFVQQHAGVYIKSKRRVCIFLIYCLAPTTNCESRRLQEELITIMY